jgi:hypothetical protein
MKTMAKRDPGLTKIKDHSYKFPLLGISSRPAKVQVLFDVETGTFSLRLPDEVTTVMKRPRDTVCTSREMHDAIRQFDYEIAKYGAIVRAENREKVIVINYKRNWPGRTAGGNIHPWSSGTGDELGDGNGFSRRNVPNLGMALSYEILWRLNGKDIFELGFNDDGTPAGDPQRRYSADDTEYKVLPWTEEREQFFEAMREGLGNMIERMNVFFANDMIANIDRAIAYGGSALSLPAPPPADED